MSRISGPPTPTLAPPVAQTCPGRSQLAGGRLLGQASAPLQGALRPCSEMPASAGAAATLAPPPGT
eukprot:4912269-Pyramimonas_sp.AAC.1